MAAKRKKTVRRARRRVYVKAHCRARPEAGWRKQLRKNREMPF
jgi:hypothetical protein